MTCPIDLAHDTPASIIERLTNITRITDQTLSFEYAREEVILSDYQDGMIVWRTFKDPYADFIWGTQIEWATISPHEACGVVLSYLDENNFFAFLVNQNQMGGIAQFKEGEDSIDLRYISEIRPAPATNDLVVMRRGNELHIYLNGIQLVYSDPFSTPNKIAIAGQRVGTSSPSSCIFRNGWVRALPPVP